MTATAANIIHLADTLESQLHDRVDVRELFRDALNTVDADGNVISLVDSTLAYCEVAQVNDADCRKAVRVAKSIEQHAFSDSEGAFGQSHVLIQRALRFRELLGVSSAQ